MSTIRASVSMTNSVTVQHQQRTARSAGIDIAYRRLGTRGRDPLVFVHGLSYFSYDWLDVAARLAIDRECVCVDSRGFGDSGSSPDKDYSVPSMAGDLKAVITDCGFDRVVMVGHSMGGRAATYLTAKNPALVGALVLVDYTPENAAAGLKRTAESVAGVPDTFESVDAAMAHFGIAPGSEKARTARARYEAYLRPVAGGFAIKRDLHFRDQFRRTLATGERPKLGVDMWQILGEVACPTLVVRGMRSDMFAAETVDKVRGANPRIELVEVEAGHNIPGENPAALSVAIRSFLNQLEQ
jgi:pimeloyl-ACP methyl ester carboxylesterase